MQNFGDASDVELKLVGQLSDGGDFAGFDQVSPGVRPRQRQEHRFLDGGFGSGMLALRDKDYARVAVRLCQRQYFQPRWIRVAAITVNIPVKTSP